MRVLSTMFLSLILSGTSGAAEENSQRVGVKVVKAYYQLGELQKSFELIVDQVGEEHSAQTQLRTTLQKIESTQKMIKESISELDNDELLTVMGQRVVAVTGILRMGTSILRSHLQASGDLDVDCVNELARINETLVKLYENLRAQE